MRDMANWDFEWHNVPNALTTYGMLFLSGTLGVSVKKFYNTGHLALALLHRVAKAFNNADLAEYFYSAGGLMCQDQANKPKDALNGALAVVQHVTRAMSSEKPAACLQDVSDQCRAEAWATLDMEVDENEYSEPIPLASWEKRKGVKKRTRPTQLLNYMAYRENKADPTCPPLSRRMGKRMKHLTS